jgi:hypothetical protein
MIRNGDLPFGKSEILPDGLVCRRGGAVGSVSGQGGKVRSERVSCMMDFAYDGNAARELIITRRENYGAAVIPDKWVIIDE